MIKVAARIFDVYDDEHGEIARQLPEELHAVKVAEHDEVMDLPDRCFALVMKTADGAVRRRLPVHDSDSLKISQAYFERTRQGLPEEVVRVVEGKFAAAQRVLDGSEDREAYNKVAYIDLGSLTPAAEVRFPDKAYGLVLEGRNHFPLHDEVLVKQAVSRFPFTIEDLESHERWQYARNIEKRANQLGVEVPSNSPINLYTAPEPNLQSLKRAIEYRKEAAAGRSDVHTTLLDQLAAAAGCELGRGDIESDASFAWRQAKHAERRKISVEHIVTVLQNFDKLAGFGDYHYMRGMPDPFAAVFTKTGSPSSGFLVDGVDLSKVDPAQLADRFDDQFVQEFTENPVAVYKSLPDPVRSVIRTFAEQNMGQPTRGRTHQEPPSTVGSAGGPMNRLNPSYVNGITLGD